MVADKATGPLKHMKCYKNKAPQFCYQEPSFNLDVSCSLPGTQKKYILVYAKLLVLI